jgi:hypothetical protein
LTGDCFVKFEMSKRTSAQFPFKVAVFYRKITIYSN